MKRVVVFLSLLFVFVGCNQQLNKLSCAKGNYKAKRYKLKNRKQQIPHYSAVANQSKSNSTDAGASTTTESLAPKKLLRVDSSDAPILPNEKQIITQVAQVPNPPVDANNEIQPVKIDSVIASNPTSKPIPFTKNTIDRDAIEEDAIPKHSTDNDVGFVNSVNTHEIRVNEKVDVALQLNYNPNTELVFNERVYDKEEDIVYYEELEFVPNYSILLNKEDVKKLDKLVALLKQYENKVAVVYGNGGMESEGLSKRDVYYQYVEKPDGTSQIERIHYGSTMEVYEQTLYGLGNSDAQELKRIEEEGLSSVSEAVIGNLLRDRAKFVKSYLIQQGIAKKRIIALRGSFYPEEYHLAKIKIENR